MSGHEVVVDPHPLLSLLGEELGHGRSWSVAVSARGRCLRGNPRRVRGLNETENWQKLSANYSLITLVLTGGWKGLTQG